MQTRTQFNIVIAAAAVALLLSPLQALTARAAGNFNVDSFFDISYSVAYDDLGNITVAAVGVTHDGERAEVPTDIVRVIRGGDFVKIYINHPGQDLITEIDVFGKELRIVGLRVVSPRKSTFRGHVTVLK